MDTLPNQTRLGDSQASPSSVDLPMETDPQSSGRRRRVLVVDDEYLITDTICAILNRNGFEAVAAYNGLEAINAAAKWKPDVVLSYVLMPKMTGVELAIRLGKELPETKVI